MINIKNEVFTFEDLKFELSKYIKDETTMDKIYKVYKFAEKNHRGQKRKSGEDFINHPLNTALFIAKWRLDEVSVCSALLHDILEDTPITYEELEKNFGNEIATIVESLTKVSYFAKENRKQIKSQYLKKLYISLAKDIRVIIIKIADRLHNMKTISYHHKLKQKEIAKETLEIYSSISHRLGMKEAQSQLEDLSFKILNPKEYAKIKNLLQTNKDKLKKILISAKEAIKKELFEKTKKSYIILNRTKSIYSIYRKINFFGKSFEDIYDILAIRIIVDSIDECYNVLGLIHKMFIPLPGKFKDFISVPKNNLYQSLHTTVTSCGYIFEIQIRTIEMDRIAKYGAAAHWRYKEGEVYNQKQKQDDIENKLDIFSQILEYNFSDKTNEKSINFETEIQEDIFAPLVYILTPKGKVIILPSGSSVLDFAYKIHSEVGNSTIGAKINGKFSSINTILNSGDLVEIMTAKSQKPNYNWLEYVKTNSAKDKIRKFLKKEKDTTDNFKKISDFQKIRIAKHDIKSKIKENKFKHIKIFWNNKKLIDNLIQNGYKNHKSFLIDVYDKLFDLNDAVKLIINSNSANTNKEQEENFLTNFNNKKNIITASKVKLNNNNDVIVKGIDNINICLSKCCYPLPLEKIVGFVSKKTRIVKIHLAECKFIKKINKNDLLIVYWNKPIVAKRSYQVKIGITAHDKTGIIMKVSSILNYHNSSIDQIIINKHKNNSNALIKMTLQIKNKNSLKQIISSISTLENIYEVKRIYN